MKKLLLTLVLLILFIPKTNASEVATCDFNTSTIDELISIYGYDYLYNFSNNLYNEVKKDYSDYSNYFLFIGKNDPNIYTFKFIFSNNTKPKYSDTVWSGYMNSSKGRYDKSIELNATIFDGDYITHSIAFEASSSGLIEYYQAYSINSNLIQIYFNNDEISFCEVYTPFMSNYYPNFIMPTDTSRVNIDINEVKLQESFNSNNYIVLSSDSDIYQFYPYTYYHDGTLDGYTTVNLDNYEYIILNLKDYTKTEPFNATLQVKGMIGITPVYEFGTVEKNEITDRCNISYSDFTDYRLYVLENDLINNAVYYVKGCQDGSSFKFDSSIFDITYVTADNVNDPVITVGGQEYHTIKFDKLSNSANQNEANNFIPGASGNGSFSSVINSITDYISSFWNGLITFMSFVTKLFNTLPVEIRAISITTFITGCTLGLIKIIKS